jgi:hypothetical protein
MTAPLNDPTSPGNGEVDREAGGRGCRFSRTHLISVVSRRPIAERLVA